MTKQITRYVGTHVQREPTHLGFRGRLSDADRVLSQLGRGNPYPEMVPGSQGDTGDYAIVRTDTRLLSQLDFRGG